MIKEISNLNSTELEQFKLLCTKYFVEEAKRTMLGLPLLYEIITKKNSKGLVDITLEELSIGSLLGYSYIEDEEVLGFIIGTEDEHNQARILVTQIAENTNKLLLLLLYKAIAAEFKNRGRDTVYIETSLYNELLTFLADEASFDFVSVYPDGYVNYEKQI